MPFLQAFDHLAIAVPDTAAALTIWREQFGFPVVYSEVVNGGTVRLTHLKLGDTHLQLVQPLTVVHPLHLRPAKNGPGLHHFCLRVTDVSAAQAILEKAGLAGANAPHQGTQGKRALFLNSGRTQGVQVEITGS